MRRGPTFSRRQIATTTALPMPTQNRFRSLLAVDAQKREIVRFLKMETSPVSWQTSKDATWWFFVETRRNC